MPAPLVAIDVALLLPQAAAARVATVNARLTPPPAGFAFDATHLPHLTLAQLFGPSADLPAIGDAVRGLVETHRIGRLEATGLAAGGATTALAIATTPALGALHARLMDRLAEFDVTAGDARAFEGDDEPARPRDVEWVTRFRTAAAYARFEPHITLGVGAVDQTAPALAFDATTVAVCALGRYCTCRRVIERWTVAGG